MPLSRILQWLGVAAVLFILVGLKYDFNSDAGETINAPTEDSLSQGLLGYWKMDEGTGTSTTADSSGNANNLTMTAMESGDWVAGNIGAYSLDFDGSAEWLTVSDPASGILDFGDGADFSIAGWFNRDTFASDHTIVSKRNGQAAGDTGYILYIDDANDDLVFEISDGTDEYSRASTGTFTATGWHHFVAAWDDGAGMNIFIDGGQNQDSASGTLGNINSLANAVAFDIGAESDNGNPFDGKIDDVKLYSHALSANEVSRLYQTTVPASPVDTGLVGHWTFDGNDVNWGDSSSEIKDVSGKGNHGDASGLTTTSVTLGKLGQGLSFNGTSDYVSVTDPASGVLDFTNGQDFSISGWFRRSDNGDWKNLLRKRGDGTNGYEFYFASENLWITISSSGEGYTLYSRTSILVGTWTHFVFVWDDDNESNTMIYLDGQSTSIYRSGTFSSVTDMSNSNSLVIGASWDGSGPFYGSIDDIRVYNRALSATEITNLYNVGK